MAEAFNAYHRWLGAIVVGVLLIAAPAEPGLPGAEAAAAPAEPPKPADPRHPVPSSEAQAEVLAQLEEVFELDKERTPQQTHKLARELYDMGRQSTEKPAERFMMLRKSMELAGAAGDAASMQAVVDVIAEDFQIDALNVKLNVLSKFAAKAKTRGRIESLVFGVRFAIDQAMQRERYEPAMKLADGVHRACQRPAGREFRKEVVELRAQIRQVYDRWLLVHQAEATLRNDADDAGAHLVLARWHCCARNDWAQGLPHLAKGSDAEMAALAATDLGPPPGDAVAQIERADAWWHLAELRQGDEQDALKRRAGHWYAKAKADVAGGLKRVKIKKRLEEIAQLEQPPLQDVAAARPARPKPGKPDSGAGFVPHFPDPARLRPPADLARQIEDPRPPGEASGVPPGAILLMSFEPSTILKQEDRLIVQDLSGMGNHGTIGGATQAGKGKAGAALLFDGKNDSVLLPSLRAHLIKNLTSLTISVWVQKTSAKKCIFSGGTSVGFGLPSARAGPGIGANGVSPGEWHHFVGVWDGTRMAVYLDGRLKSEKTTPSFTLNGGSISKEAARLGTTAKSHKRAGRYYAGLLDELAIYPRALSQPEIRALLQMGLQGKPLAVQPH